MLWLELDFFLLPVSHLTNYCAVTQRSIRASGSRHTVHLLRAQTALRLEYHPHPHPFRPELQGRARALRGTPTLSGSVSGEGCDADSCHCGLLLFNHWELSEQP